MDVESTMLPLGTKMPSFNLLGIEVKCMQVKCLMEKKVLL